MVISPARHELSFWHGLDRLDGDLRLPPTAGPHPVLIIVQEPDRAQRDYSAWLDALACAGIASFTWDRPPGGGPTPGGSRWVRHQARAVLAAAEKLRGLPVVDPSAVAVLGRGEGCWAAAQAVTFSEALRALVLMAAPTRRTASDDPGDPGNRHDPGDRHAPDDPYDPRPTLTAVTVPVLALFGEQDDRIPLETAVGGVRDALRDGGHADHEIAVVRGADHGLCVRAPHGLGSLVGGRHRFGDWPPGLTRLLADWLDRRLRVVELPTFAPPLQAPPARVRPHVRTAQPLPAPVRQVRRRVRT